MRKHKRNLLVFGLLISALVFSQATVSKVQAQTGTIKRVCQLGPNQDGCDYTGADAIQQAVDAATDGTMIYIDAGKYTRSTFSTYTNPNGFLRKCFVKIVNKKISLIGKSTGDSDFNMVRLDGYTSAPMSGICIKDSEVVIRGINASGFKADVNCGSSTTVACSKGNGIQYEGTVSKAVTITNVKTNSNAGHGFTTTGVVVLRATNNTSVDNILSGFSCSNSSRCYFINNIAVGNMNYGFYFANIDPIVVLKYNLAFDNTTAGANLPNIFAAEANHNLTADPRFVLTTSSYHLATTPVKSPAIDSGDTTILDKDGTRSDMGVFGGPDACFADYSLPGCPAGGPTEAPTTTITPDLSPTLNPLYTCSQNTNICMGNYAFEKYTTTLLETMGSNYPETVSCNNSVSVAKYTTPPTVEDRDGWCQRLKRTKGDADGNGVVDFIDYNYYLQVISGGRVGARINTDFNGDGQTGLPDFNILKYKLEHPES